jgi:hypothetical protein
MLKVIMGNQQVTHTEWILEAIELITEAIVELLEAIVSSLVEMVIQTPTRIRFGT